MLWLILGVRCLSFQTVPYLAAPWSTHSCHKNLTLAFLYIFFACLRLCFLPVFLNISFYLSVLCFASGLNRLHLPPQRDCLMSLFMFWKALKAQLSRLGLVELRLKKWQVDPSSWQVLFLVLILVSKLPWKEIMPLVNAAVILFKVMRLSYLENTEVLTKACAKECSYDKLSVDSNSNHNYSWSKLNANFNH